MAFDPVADPTAYIDKIFEFDEERRREFNQVSEGSNDFTSGSAAEGAFICRGVQDHTKQNYEIDTMRPIGEIPFQKSSQIMTSTDQAGYYRLRFNEVLLSCLDKRFSELLKMNDTEKEYLDGHLMKLYNKMLESDNAHRNYYTTNYDDGSPSVYGKTDVAAAQIETDTVLCIKLLFWPNIVDPWFKRKRYWPCPEIVSEINLSKCHLVLKASNEDGGSKDKWRLSLSLAEAILSKDKSVFQKKCYLLAKFMYYANLKQHTDEETGRHLPSYLLKTTMLSMLEQTNQEEWINLEVGKCYIEVVCRLFKRLADSLNLGYLAFFFVEEINLLERGFSKVFLKKMAKRIESVCEEWKGAEGEKLFHARINHMYNKIRLKESPSKKTGMEFLDIGYENNKTQYLRSGNSNPTALSTMEKMKATMENNNLTDDQKDSIIKNLQKDISISDMVKLSLGGGVELEAEVAQGFLTQKQADQARVKVSQTISKNLLDSMQGNKFLKQLPTLGNHRLFNSILGNGNHNVTRSREDIPDMSEQSSPQGLLNQMSPRAHLRPIFQEPQYVQSNQERDGCRNCHCILM